MREPTSKKKRQHAGILLSIEVPEKLFSSQEKQQSMFNFPQSPKFEIEKPHWRAGERLRHEHSFFL